jgi:hypothetical protein
VEGHVTSLYVPRPSKDATRAKKYVGAKSIVTQTPLLSTVATFLSRPITMAATAIEDARIREAMEYYLLNLEGTVPQNTVKTYKPKQQEWKVSRSPSCYDS